MTEEDSQGGSGGMGPPGSGGFRRADPPDQHAPATGDARVDDAVAGLRRLQGRPAEEHVAVLEEAHGRLRDILDDLGPDRAPAGGTAGGGRGDGVPPDRSAVVPPGQP
jgi:hypothetical protein